MSDQYLGEIRIVPFNYAPKGWAFCDGRLIPLSQNTALYSLIGTTYGGNGTTNFELPNFNGNVPVCQGQGPGLTRRTMGEAAGTASVTLTSNEIPQHIHMMIGSMTDASETQPTGALPAIPQSSDPRNPGNLYDSSQPTTPMLANGVLPTGGNQPHNNMQPYLALTFIISLTGIYPARG